MPFPVEDRGYPTIMVSGEVFFVND